MPRTRPTALVALIVAVAPGGVLVAVAPTAAAAQQPGAWNSDRTLALVERARERRQLPVIDASLRNYRADVSGHIYFFIDRADDPEPVLLRSDQVALELYWGQPDRVKQVIQGMRTEEQFPLRDFRYYLDRYTVIQNGFDDIIRVGEGRDVRNVIHPLAEPGRHFYDFRLADSTTIRLPAQPEPIRVYEIEVRPRDLDRPGIVGSLYLERARGDLVRLAFTFTPASYIDPRNERVEVMLENALWDGRYWLPREQRLLVRRELPQFDIDVGTVIRAALTVDSYELNADLPDDFFGGRSVVMSAPEALAAYDFDEGLFDGLDDVGLAPGTDPGTLDDVDIEAIADSIIRQRFLRGISRVRFFAPTGSDILRYDRTQGLVTGGGASIGWGRHELYGHGGWAWASEAAVGEIGWQPAGRSRRLLWSARAYLLDPVDLGLRPGAAGVLASASAAFLGQDLRDVALTTGLEVGFTGGDARAGRFVVTASLETRPGVHWAATSRPFNRTRAFRPTPRLEQIYQQTLALRYERRAGIGRLRARVRPSIEVGRTRGSGPVLFGPDDARDRDHGIFARAMLDGSAAWTDADRVTGVLLRGTAAFNMGAATWHHVRYLGGRNTLPGHGFHEYVGDHAAVVDVSAWRTLVPRWIRLRASASAGWAVLRSDPPFGDSPPPSWNPRPTDGIASSIGVGVGVIDGLLRLDYGVRTDTWDGALILSIEPALWSFL